MYDIPSMIVKMLELNSRIIELEKLLLTQTDKENIKALIFGDANINEAEFESLKTKLGIE